jgi:hypothetical protein
MQIIQAQPNDWNFFCPLTGVKGFHDDGWPNAPTLRGGWCYEMPDETIYLAEELKSLWAKYLAAQEADEHLLDIMAIHRSVELPNWVVLEITTRGMARGPVWSQEWTLLKLNNPDESEEG